MHDTDNPNMNDASGDVNDIRKDEQDYMKALREEHEAEVAQMEAEDRMERNKVWETFVAKASATADLSAEKAKEMWANLKQAGNNMEIEANKMEIEADETI